MPVLPQKFDMNEWFNIITLIAGYGAVYLMRRHFPRTITVLILMFSMIVAKITDQILGLPPYDLYDFNDTDKYDLMDLITWFIYPPFGYIFVYFFDKWHLRGIPAAVYILFWAIFAVSFEWFAFKAHVFTYKGWMLPYSFTMYLIVLNVYLLFFKFAQYYFHKTQIKDSVS